MKRDASGTWALLATACWLTGWLLLLTGLSYGALPPCGAAESACERPVAGDCDCNGDPCKAGEWCAAAGKACPHLERLCRDWLPAVTSTTTTSTTTTSTTLPCRASQRLPTSPTYCGCEGIAELAEEWEDYGTDEDGGCIPIGGRLRWQCPGQPERSGTYRYEAPGQGLLCPRATLVASANCGCVSPVAPTCEGSR